MNLEDMSDDEVREHIRNSLKNEWIILSGPLEYTQQVEEHIYPPNTEENKNYELILSTGSGKVQVIHLAKKTKKLQEFISTLFIKSKFESLLAVILDKNEQKLINSNQGVNINDAIDAVIGALWK